METWIGRIQWIIEKNGRGSFLWQDGLKERPLKKKQVLKIIMIKVKMIYQIDKIKN